MVKRYENVQIKNVTNSVSTIGEQTTSVNLWFETRASVNSVANNLRISDRYRAYSDLVHFTFNYTPNMKTIVDNQDLYSMYWRGKDWRIESCREHDDRQFVTFTCYRNDPVAPV
jgi:hypothetical protein